VPVGLGMARLGKVNRYGLRLGPLQLMLAGGAVGVVPEGYRLIAKSSYVQVIQHPGRLRYGMQFHPEIRRPWNQAAGMLENFLREALRARRSESRAPLRGESS